MASCWVRVMGQDGKWLVPSAEKIKPCPEDVSDLRHAVQDAYKQDVLAHVSAGRLIVYAPEDGERQQPLEPDAQIPNNSSAKKPIIVEAPSGTYSVVGLLCLFSLSFSFSFMCNADVH
jgi:hypothetical protein